MTSQEITEFKDKLSFYRFTNEKFGKKIKRIAENLKK